MSEGKAGFHSEDCASPRILDEKRLSNNGKLGLHDPAAQSPKLTCPECGSKRLFKDGLRYLKDGSTVQRLLCRDCGYRFSQPQVKVDIPSKPLKASNPRKDNLKKRILNVDFPFKEISDSLPLPISEDVASHDKSTITTTEKGLNTLPFYNSKRQVCVSEREAKNLAKSEARQEKAQREGTAETADVKGKIIQFLWHLKRKGKYVESTIKQTNQLLRLLIKNGVNLLKPDSITDFLATKNEWSASYKNQIASVYNSFVKFINLQFEPPVFKSAEKLPFIPTEKEIDQLIAGCGPKTSTFLQLLKETGMRAGEAVQLKWADIDFENNTVRVTPLKRGRARMLKISDKLVAMLRRLPHDSIKVWPVSLTGKRDNFTKQRRRLALKLDNPRIDRIHFHTFRHWKATMEYHKTKDLLHVMKMLGHRKIQSTLIYTQLIDFEANHYI
ncbi:MAG: tyrosine-type recombinase/integrase [Candidatus Bathyarchaeia archaeon]|nr:tyrosine-type recombinase/integrase [Candidatus Bathyarchaeia archaeon]